MLRRYAAAFCIIAVLSIYEYYAPYRAHCIHYTSRTYTLCVLAIQNYLEASERRTQRQQIARAQIVQSTVDIVHIYQVKYPCLLPKQSTFSYI